MIRVSKVTRPVTPIFRIFGSGLFLVMAGCGAEVPTTESEGINTAQVQQASTGLGAPIGARSWSKMPPFPGHGNPGNMALLTDGRVLASGPGAGADWWTLTPDHFGQYVTGTWAPAGSSKIGRIFNPAFVLKDGRYWNCGGEDVSVGTNLSECEIFDPLGNNGVGSWSDAPSMSEAIADTPSAILNNGQVLTLANSSSNSYLFNPYPSPGVWTSAAAYDRITPGNAGGSLDSESGSLLLADGSVLFGGRKFSRYVPGTDSWIPTAQTPGLAGNEFNGSNSDGSGPRTPDTEIGPFLMLYTGKVLILGGNSHNGLYTPPATLTGAGSWALARDTPIEPTSGKPLNHGDAPSVVMPNGNVLTVASTDPTGVGQSASFFYEYDPVSDTWTAIPNPNDPTDDGVERVRLLVLPSGDILVSGFTDGAMFLYDSLGKPQDSWRPAITSVSLIFSQYRLAGSQLNGLTTGADFGDDGKLATNYPIVGIHDENSGETRYVRSYGFGQMAPTPGVRSDCWFKIPSDVGGTKVSVTANGVSTLQAFNLPQKDVGPALLTAIL
jgi:hypothetical protein